MSGLVPMSEKEMKKRAKQKREMLYQQQEALRKAVEKAKEKQDDWVMVERASAIDMIKHAIKKEKVVKEKLANIKKSTVEKPNANAALKDSVEQDVDNHKARFACIIIFSIYI